MVIKNKVRESYGVALIKPPKKAGEQLQILLVKKRCSYHFCDFVHGKYRIGDDAGLRHMFNHMTACEKAYILGGSFDEIWYKMWLNHPLCNRTVRDLYKAADAIDIRNEYYFSCEKKYIDLYSTGTLKQLIQGTSSISGIWELPKGKRKNLRFDKIDEKPLEAAIREFHEEVHIDPADYELLDSEPLRFSVEDEKIVYNTSVYICLLKNENWVPQVSFDKYSFFTEIDDIGWFSCSRMGALNTTDKQRNLLLTQYKTLAARFRKVAVL